MTAPLATHVFTPGELEAVLEFLKRSRWELRELRVAQVWKDRFRVYDINRDYFEIAGLGYLQPEIVPVLKAVYAAFDPKTVHEPTEHEPKEFLTGRRRAWAEDRVM